MQGNSKSESDWQVSTATKNMKYYSLLDLSRELCLFWLIYGLIAQVVSALACYACGRWSESILALH